MNQSVTVQSSQKWHEEKSSIQISVDIIHLSATADGITTGPLWITRLESRGCKVSAGTRRILYSKDFTLSNHGMLKIAILRGSSFQHADRLTSVIQFAARQLGLTKPETDMGCLFREILSNAVIEEMGLQWVNIMHEPIVVYGSPKLLCVSTLHPAEWLMSTAEMIPNLGWAHEVGFAFAASRG